MIECIPNTLSDRVDTLGANRVFKIVEAKSHAKLEIEGLPKKRQSSTTKLNIRQLFVGWQNNLFNRTEVIDEIENQVRIRTADLYRKANFDALTHLPNRRYFHDLLDELVAGYKNTQEPFALLFLDLDGFKKVNDSLGHNIGDELLRHVGARLQSSIRHVDVASRLGGDEFVILLTNTLERETIEMICKRVIKEVSRGYCFDGLEVKTSTSIGVARFPEDADTSSDLIELADAALYVSKESGKKRYSFYGESSGRSTVGHFAIQNRFNEALNSGKVEIYAEPVVEIESGKLVAAEVNLVWLNDDNVKSDYDGWAGYLEKSGRDYSVALWWLDSACFYLQRWHKENSKLFASVRVVDALWRDDDFMTILLKRVELYQLKPKQLNLMFSLSDLVSYDSVLADRIRSLKLLGFQVTLVGLGEAPVDASVMSDLEMDYFKFDRTWLEAQLHSEHGSRWIEALINLSTTLGASVFVSGQAAQTEVALLKKMGASYSQGPFWGPNMTVQKFGHWVGQDLIDFS